MSERKRISPMLDNFDMGGPISEHHGVRCYPAMRKDSDERYIIKTVSIPASQTQLDALLLTGAFPDAASALTYFKEMADQTVSELDILQKLSQLEGFLPYEDWQIVSKDDEVGFDVYMISPYKRSLRKFLQKNPMTHLGAVNLGLDICAALAVCRRSGYLYTDLKPNNIYVLDEKQFRIGDIGFIALDSLSYASLPDRCRSEYTAPEVMDTFATLNSTIDIYAIGLILHQIYNGGVLPAAGEDGKFPAPENADYEMAEIILKACDPDPAARWQDPVEMGQALVSYMQRNGVNDTPIVPPVIPVAEPASEPEAEESTQIDDTDLSDIDLINIPEIEELAQDVDVLLPSEPDNSEETPAEMIAEEDIPTVVDAPADEPTTEAIPEEKQPDAEVSVEAENEETLDAEKTPAVKEDTEYDEDSFGNLSFLEILPEDETAPENNVSDVGYDEITDELSQILAQADELVAHPVPDPVVAPEPVEVTLPETEVALTEDVPTPVEETGEESEPDEAPTTSDVSQDETVVIPAPAAQENQAAEEAADEEAEVSDEVPVKKRNVLRWVLNTILILLILAILATGFFYYRNIYLLPINDITVTGNESSMIVTVDSNIDESLLSVVCSDSHGNQISAPVVNGQATFANLSPDTAYNIKLLVDGFHRLTGETAASYSTPAQTNVAQFTAVTGTENGSVILAFTVEGPDNGDWSVAYYTDGEEPKTVEMLSHMTTLTGLTVGKEYHFVLLPGEDMYVTGQTEISFTASDLVYAENVNIISCVNNQLTATWTAPEGSNVSEWTVRCYDDADYNETLIIADTTAVFDNVDPAKSYTVEVLAAGMSVSQRAYMSANAITITDFQATVSGNKMKLSWNASESVPEGGWVLRYTVDNCDIQSSVSCTDNSAVISPIVPDSTYTFTLQKTNGDGVLTVPLICEVSKAQDFSGYGMIRASMTYSLCKQPEDADWRYTEIKEEDYTNTFAVGEKISVVGQLHDTYGISDDPINIMYVFRNADNEVVSYCYSDSHWDDMWSKSYGEFNIPQAPTEAGEYIMDIYFNGKLVTVKAVNIEA